jgi:AcrR family transcriptional regulator
VTTYHHGDLRAAILRAAGEQLEKHGIAALSLRDAARRAGVSHNAPYRHFPSRESLLTAIATEGFELLNSELGKRPAAEMGLAYVEFALGHPQRFRLMFGGYPSPAGAYLGAYLNPGAFGSFGEEAPFAAAAAWSLVHGLTHLILEGHFAAAQRENGGAAAFAAKVLGAVRLARSQRTA